MKRPRPPKLPKELYRISPVKTILGIAYAFGLWCIPVIAMNQLWRLEPNWTVMIVSIPLIILAAQGLVLLVFMGHDGTHTNLVRNRFWSTLLGVIITIPAWPHCEMGFALCHWNHHRYTNTDSDPDCVGYKPYKNLFSRMFLSRISAFTEYFLTTVQMVFGSQTDRRKQYSMGVQGKQRRFIAALNLCTWTSMLGLIAWTGFTNPILFAILMSVLFVAIIILGINPYIEHAGTDIGHGKDTRSRMGWWWSVFYLGNNYHLSHHLYPSIPFYNLPKVHAFLEETGFLKQHQSHVSHGFLGTCAYAFGHHQYPEGDAEDDPFDVVKESLTAAN